MKSRFKIVKKGKRYCIYDRENKGYLGNPTRPDAISTLMIFWDKSNAEKWIKEHEVQP
ncbi:MAG: hypothetical protein J7J52_01185 [Deltaproteobacteria bacterium]|nr:hypothetical protein [Deltaproteobacteria bacterium]